MKFKCGLTAEEKYQLHMEGLARADALREWHPVFAWLLVSIDEAHCRWFETVERRLLHGIVTNRGELCGAVWQCRVKTTDA